MGTISKKLIQQMNEYYGTEYIKEDKPKAEACFIDPDTGQKSCE